MQEFLENTHIALGIVAALVFIYLLSSALFKYIHRISIKRSTLSKEAGNLKEIILVDSNNPTARGAKRRWLYYRLQDPKNQSLQEQ
jgi:hypothetical protein